jgi:hypothetical protein
MKTEKKRKAKLYEITPLGAAIVEAMSDRKLVAKILRDYQRSGKVPASRLFQAIPGVDFRPTTGN